MKNTFPGKYYNQRRFACLVVFCGLAVSSCAHNPEKKITEQLQVREHAEAMRDQIAQQFTTFDTIQNKEVVEKINAYGKVVGSNYDAAIFEREIRKALKEQLPPDSLEALAERLQDPKFIAINARLLKGIKNNNLQTRNAYFQDDRVPLYPKYKKAILFADLTKYMQSELTFANTINNQLHRMQPKQSLHTVKNQKKSAIPKTPVTTTAVSESKEKLMAYELRFLSESDLDWLIDHAHQPLWQQYYAAYELGVDRAIHQIEEKVMTEGNSTLMQPIVKTDLKKKLD